MFHLPGQKHNLHLKIIIPNTPINNLLFVEINIPNKEPKLDVLQYIILLLNIKLFKLINNTAPIKASKSVFKYILL